MNIKLAKPYKIARERLRRYESHYKIPAMRSLIIPLKELGDEVSCDVRWENENGELQLLQNKIFMRDSLVPINSFSDPELLELWEHYYNYK